MGVTSVSPSDGQPVVEVPHPVRLTPTTLEFGRKLEWEEWCQLGASLSQTEASIQWWIGDWYLHGENHHSDKPVEQAVEEFFGVQRARETVRHYAWVCSSIPPVCRQTRCSFTHHALVAGLPTEQRDAILVEIAEAPSDEQPSTKDIRARVRDLKRGEYEPGPMPDGQYNVILADPPWRYEISAMSGAAENHYPTMAVQEIEALAVPAADNAALFLWATAPLLPEALTVMGAWGFEYRTGFVWDKVIPGIGFWGRGQFEHFLIGVRGKFSPPPPDCRKPSIFVEKRRKHSRKPDVAYKWIEAAYPQAKKLELFARAKRDGWTVWGDEAGGKDSCQ